MRHSFFSTVVVVITCSAAAAGWFGVRLAPPEETASVLAASAERADTLLPDGAQPGVRNRAAWQPSPIPGQPAASQPAQQGTLLPTPAAQPGTRSRAAWQPSPIPSQAQSQSSQARLQTGPAPAGLPALPSLGAAPALGGAAAMAPGASGGDAGNAGALGSLLTSAGSGSTYAELGYTPISQMFTTDRLEALFNGGLPEERGVWQERRFFSPALGREEAYLVWLPPGYETSKQRYPTLYLLHGVGGANGFGVEEWLGYALTEDLDRMLALGLIEPMIVVLPNGEQGYWINHANGGPRWADYVANDLVKDVDKNFRTEARRERRAIGGLSMGAHGALQLALNRPDVFAIAGAHSPTLRPFETTPEFFGDQKWFAKYDPLSLARNTDAPAKLTIWIDVGHQDDEWRPGAEVMYRALRQKNAAVEFHLLEGEHEGWYWTYYLPEYLDFYSAALHASATTPKGAPVVLRQPLLARVASLAAEPGLVAQPILAQAAQP
jgi:S-formylglutathione hydrolase FrmB